MSVFVHPQGLCESDAVGSGTRIWAFAHVAAGARIGDDCNICDHVFIEGGARIGDRVTVKSGVQLWDGVELQDDVFVGPNATFTNDPFPRSRQRPAHYTPTIIRAGASIGAGATILPGIEIRESAMVGAGAVVTRSVPRHAIVAGNPARIIGYANADFIASPTETNAVDLAGGGQPGREPGITASTVRGVSLHVMPMVRDLRGSLTAAEFGDDIGFQPQRWFMVFDVPGVDVRGEHAHHECHQFLVCVNGSVVALVDDGTNREQFVLDSRQVGLYVPPLTWGVQYRYSPDAALLVFASHRYDPDDYIREYDHFLEVVEKTSDNAF